MTLTLGARRIREVRHFSILPNVAAPENFLSGQEDKTESEKSCVFFDEKQKKFQLQEIASFSRQIFPTKFFPPIFPRQFFPANFFPPIFSRQIVMPFFPANFSRQIFNVIFPPIFPANFFPPIFSRQFFPPFFPAKLLP